MFILGIETSCDETGLAVYSSTQGLVAHVLYSQVALHAAFGGVVPELASRDHVRKVIPLLKKLMAEAGITLSDLSGVAYTAGPGLIGALMAGATFAKSLAWALKIPSLGVHHMEAHLLAPMLEPEAPDFPFMALLVSGGHTMLVEVAALGVYEVLGETLDDAVGEAFDKTAKLLGLPYPGGPLLAKLAEQGDPNRFRFARPMVNRPGLDFSFSGLKTQVLTTLQRLELDAQTKADLARGFEEAVVDTLAIKCKRAMTSSAYTRLVVAGGVGANLRLRERLQALMHALKGEVFFPRLAFCTDNGAMVAYVGALRIAAGQQDTQDFTLRPRWPLKALIPLN